MLYRGSYHNGLAPRDFDPAYPELWRGCVYAACPSLGPTGGVLRDWSGRQNHGTLTNTTLDTVWANSHGYCLSLAGTDDYVAIPHSSVLSFANGTTWGLSCWVNQTSAATQFIYAKDNGGANGNPMVYISAAGEVHITYDGTGVNAAYDSDAGSITAGQWDHLLISYTFGIGSSMAVYVNGVLKGGSWTAGTGDNVAVTNTSPLYLGSRVEGGVSLPFIGKIDDVRIYNRGFNASDRSLLYSNGRGRGVAYSYNQPRGSLTPGDSSGSSGSTFPGLAWRALRKWRFVVRAGVDGNWPRVT